MDKMVDVVIVGAGSAGCVLASRLSEDPACRVLLLEAGPDYRAASTPDDIRSAADLVSSHDWGYQSAATAAGNRIALLRGKLVGGSSATNACFAIRGHDAVYDEWAAMGNGGWAFTDVLPSFVALERDLDRDDPWHGSDGPVAIRRYTSDERTTVQNAFLAACAALGYPAEDDLNRPGAHGVGAAPTNAVDGIRQSTALAYLEPARERSNLTVRAGAEVDAVVVERGRAAGVRLVGGEVIRAAEVILSAGAYASPSILLRSGIGPADELAALGIEVLADVPGVGRNLVDHPVVWQFAATAAPAPVGTAAFQSVLSWPTGADPAPDLHVFARYATADGALFGVFASVMRPSSRGTVRLASSDPGVAPLIDPAFLTEPGDVKRMVDAMSIAQDAMRTEPLASLVDASLAPTEDFAAYAIGNVQTYFHPVGTCRMGPADDPGAVVDRLGRVHAIDGLSVVDASTMPTIPSANTNLPVIMVAEHVVRLRREDGAGV